MGARGPPEEFLGYVFLESFQHEGRTIGVLVGITNTCVISEVSVKGIDGIDEELLARFRGKNLESNFDLARTPEDLLFVPVKIKSMKEEPALSESIARGVKEIAMAAIKVVR